MEKLSICPSFLQIAIIGSGPSGFYAADFLLQSLQQIKVDVFDRLPTPFGLVRGGVAPDHAKIKSVANIYEKIASHPNFRFFGNVEYGRDITLEDLKNHYHAIIFAVGAKSDRKMDIPGEDLMGSSPATDFVGWYNGHPDYRHLSFDLTCERVAVIGNGNVAMDVARILAQNPSHLESTDIASYALEALKKSKVKEIYLCGRRGVAQAAFTNPEIRELCDLDGADLRVDPPEVALDDLSQASLEQTGSVTAKNNVKILQEHSQKPLSDQPRKIVVRFLVSPVELTGANGKVVSMKLEKNKLYKQEDGSLRPKGTGLYETLPVNLVLRSVGYKGVPISELPYDSKNGTIPNEKGRVIDPKNKSFLSGLYVVGWAKRGPTGVIGTNKPDSGETVRGLLEDYSLGKLSKPEKNSNDIVSTFEKKGVRFVDYSGWKLLDKKEIETGKKVGKVREKLTSIEEMLAVLNHNP